MRGELKQRCVISYPTGNSIMEARWVTPTLQLAAPEVKAAIKHAVERITAAAKAAGIIGGGDYAEMRDIGVTFLGLSADVTVIATALRGLAKGAREELGLDEV